LRVVYKDDQNMVLKSQKSNLISKVSIES